VLKNTASLATLGIFGSSGAAASSPESNYYHAIEKEMIQVYDESGSDGLRDVLEDHRLEYRHSQGNPSEEGANENKLESPEEGERVSPQRAFGQSESEVNVVSFATPESNNEVRVQTIVKLDGWSGSFRDCLYVDDVIGIDWTGDWTLTDQSIRTPSDHHEINFWSESLNGGLAAKVDLDSDKVLPWIDSNELFLLAATLKTGSGTPGSVFGSYQHNYALLPTGKIQGISGSNGAGPLNVSLSLQAQKKWDYADPSDAPDVIE
jgi:hypothetical protein